MGLSEDEMKQIIKKWRETSPNICKMWRDVEAGVKKAIKEKNVEYWLTSRIMAKATENYLFIQLPSLRRIAYAYPAIEYEAENDRETITYYGTVQETGGWGKNRTWGGKLVENIVQATARDCLTEAMLRLDEAGYEIVMHVHDEIISEMEYGKGSLSEVIRIMSEPMEWYKGLLLTADGYETEYYRKD